MDLCCDPTKLNIQEPTILPQERAQARKQIIHALYPDRVDLTPPNIPRSCDKSVQINAFIDADHTIGLTTRRSQIGILIYINMAPIIWLSKRKNKCEASTFGSKFVAMRIIIELLVGLR